MTRVELKTGDGVSLIGDYYAPSKPSSRGLLLLHMMPATRKSWVTLAGIMQAAGWHALAIDLRGHGESAGGPPGTSPDKSGPDGYRKFSDAEHQASRHDVEAGIQFLKSKGVFRITLGGASIGANLALQYLAARADAGRAFLLSPGLDYRGIRIEEDASRLAPGQGVYYLAARDDAYSAETIERLFAATPAGVEKRLKLFDAAGHGTAMFEREPESLRLVTGWLQADNG